MLIHDATSEWQLLSPPSHGGVREGYGAACRECLVSFPPRFSLATGVVVRVLLQCPPQTLSRDRNVRGRSFTADGVSLVGCWHNRSDNWPEALRWVPSGTVSEPLGNYPHLALVVSPDGSHIAGRSGCTGALRCAGVSMFDGSASGETQFYSAGSALAQYEHLAMSSARRSPRGGLVQKRW